MSTSENRPFADIADAAVTRRRLLKIAGAAGGAMLITSRAADPAYAGPLAEGSPEAAVARLFELRARAARSGRTTGLSAWYGGSRVNDRVGFEVERARRLSMLGSEWEGRVADLRSVVDIVRLRRFGDRATAHVYETTVVHWTPRPRTYSRAEQAARDAEPGRFAGSTSAVTSSFGVAHDLTLERSGRGWVVTRDSYIDTLLNGESPDFRPRSWADVNGGTTANGSLTVGRAATARPLAAAVTRTFDYMAAKAYADAHWSSYSSSYCNYNACGGDCANFVSQCLRAGGYPDDGTWGTHSGACGSCSTSSTHAGSTAWVNNWSLRNWEISSGRGVDSVLSLMGYACFINYDWTGNGSYDHVALVTNPTGPLVTAHNSDHHNVPWKLGAGSSAKFKYTYTKLYYTA